MSVDATHPAIRPLRIAVLCPHFAPDNAPTGEVMTAIVAELASFGHELHVVTSLPWYRTRSIEPEWEGRRVRRTATPWGSITRVHPFPPKRRSIVRQAAGFVGFSALTGITGLRGGRVDVVLAMSPPFTMGLTGWAVHLVRRGPLVFNIQDVYPDAAIATGVISDRTWKGRTVIAVAKWVERFSYHRAAAVTVLSEDMRRNVAAKVAADRIDDVIVIPNFVDTRVIEPLDRRTDLRRELGIGDEPVVMYAGNIGHSQSLEMFVDAARAIPEATFVLNGDGVAREGLEGRAAGLANVRFSGYQPRHRLAEVLATGDVHVVPLRAGLGSVSVPSKTYSILAAARPVLAAIDPGTEVPRLLAASGGGVAVPPDELDAFVAALLRMIADTDGRARMGAAGREWVETNASAETVARAYERLFVDLVGGAG